MDPNLLYWKSQGQSFFSRLKTWMGLLDPVLLLSSDAEIQKAHTLISNGEKLTQEDESALILSLSSIHADTGETLPLIFRPSAVFPIAGPLMMASLSPPNTVKSALFWQFLLQSYTVGFNNVHRNKSSEQDKPKTPLKHLVLMAGTVSVTTCAGALPQIIINRLRVASPPIQTFCRSIIPIPLSAALAFFNVLTVRYEECEAGIQVFDQNGTVVGLSKAAGEQAVKDTALTRAVLFGTTAAVPNLLALLLKRYRPFQRNSLLLVPFRPIALALMLGLMIPVSFSLFPHVGTIKREKLEAELQGQAVDGPFFYHRGL